MDSFLSVRTPPLNVKNKRGKPFAWECMQEHPLGRPTPAPAGATGTRFLLAIRACLAGTARAAQPALLPTWLRAVGRMGCQPGDTNCFSVLVNALRYLCFTGGQEILQLLGASVPRDLPLFHLRKSMKESISLSRKVKSG